MSQNNCIFARDLRPGQKLIVPRVTHPIRVESVTLCRDGSVRVVTPLSDSRMTGCIVLRVAH